ncbi:hypothetical protein HK102_000915 [Quaeritorhiza haematococci]|nr:hypothetical protein HK102_000915 [Quaeritorhiza haematococci]
MSFDAVNFSPYSPPRDTLPSGSSSSAGGIASTFSSFSRGGYSPIGASSTSAAAGSSSNQPFVSPSNLEQAERVNKYETALPIRLDVEAVLCYALGCISGEWGGGTRFCVRSNGVVSKVLGVIFI